MIMFLLSLYFKVGKILINHHSYKIPWSYFWSKNYHIYENPVPLSIRYPWSYMHDTFYSQKHATKRPALLGSTLRPRSKYPIQQNSFNIAVKGLYIGGTIGWKVKKVGEGCIGMREKVGKGLSAVMVIRFYPHIGIFDRRVYLLKGGIESLDEWFEVTDMRVMGAEK